jgi:uncharacterized membrane protein
MERPNAPGSGRSDHHEEPSLEPLLGSDPRRLPTHVASALCYSLSFVSGAVFLMLEHEDRSVRFHAYQSILVGVVAMALMAGITILGWVPPLGLFLGAVLRWLTGFAWLALSVFLVLKAYGGENYQLPYLGHRAARLADPFGEG